MKLGDLDSADRAQKLHALGWSCIGGIVFAIGGGFKFGMPGFVLGWIVGTGVSYVVTMLVADQAGGAGASIYFGSGSSTPHARQYSLAQSYAVRGLVPQAIEEYERSAAQFPDDPVPGLCLARLYRDQLKDFDRSAEWFRQALAIEGIEPQVEISVLRELVELHQHRMNEPGRAMTMLAKLAQKHPESSAGKWAREELAALKQEMQK